jgi:hypothetical protein
MRSKKETNYSEESYGQERVAADAHDDLERQFRARFLVGKDEDAAGLRDRHLVDTGRDGMASGTSDSMVEFVRADGRKENEDANVFCQGGGDRTLL